MKLITIGLNDGNEIHGHVQTERHVDGGTKLTCVDENGFLFDVEITENNDKPLD